MMSFDGFKSVIEEGDTVILYLTVNQIYNIKAEGKAVSKKGVVVDNVFQTSYGALKCSDVIGKEYGSKISLSKGWGYVLQPSPELWTITLPHRTQIIYTPDISMIVLQLEIRPGSVVVESGTGSGSLSHALIRSVKPQGRLCTFDFHEARAGTAREEFARHGLADYVTVLQRDVCMEGFGDEMRGKADAVFLDLPHPWLAIPHAISTLKQSGGRICSFSPCIEQVQKSCVIFHKLAFQEIQTVEVLQTQYSVQTRNMNVIDLEFVKTEKNGSELSSSSSSEKRQRETVKTVSCMPPNSLPGHSGYLTFATLPPLWARQLQININEEECGS